MRDNRLRRDSMFGGSDTDSCGQHPRKAARAYVAILAALLASLWFGSSPVVAQAIKIVALGDSLTAGFGLTASEAFPAQLEAALKKRGHDVSIVNAGVSGDTSAGGLARLDWSVPDGTDAVILVLGANDMLRGLDPAQTRKALDDAIKRLKARKIDVLVGGMRAAPNLGAEYAGKFDSIYPELAKEHDVLIYAFFLDGVAGQRELNLSDGIHPTAKGVSLVVERIIPSVESLIERAKKRRG
jgi:acyl-CoA thioesterase I